MAKYSTSAAFIVRRCSAPLQGMYRVRRRHALQNALQICRSLDSRAQDLILQHAGLKPLTNADVKDLWAAWWPTALGASSLMLALTQGHRRSLIRHEFARKAIHILIGMVFMSFWPLFPDSPYSPAACASVPLLCTLAVSAVGAGLVREPALVAAASVRSLDHLKGDADSHAQHLDCVLDVMLKATCLHPLILFTPARPGSSLQHVCCVPAEGRQAPGAAAGPDALRPHHRGVDAVLLAHHTCWHHGHCGRNAADHVVFLRVETQAITAAGPSAQAMEAQQRIVQEWRLRDKVLNSYRCCASATVWRKSLVGDMARTSCRSTATR